MYSAITIRMMKLNAKLYAEGGLTYIRHLGYTNILGYGA